MTDDILKYNLSKNINRCSLIELSWWVEVELQGLQESNSCDDLGDHSDNDDDDDDRSDNDDDDDVILISLDKRCW